MALIIPCGQRSRRLLEKDRRSYNSRVTTWFRCAIVPALVLFSACASPPAVREQRQTAPLQLTPAGLSWGPGPASLPAGTTAVVLEGDPTTAGSLFTMRVRLPAGSEIAPHIHPANERVTIISGSLFVGFGDRIDRAASTRLGAGSYYINPPGLAHYLWTDEEVILQLTGIGPWRLEYLRSADR